MHINYALLLMWPAEHLRSLWCRYDFEAYTEDSEKMYRVFLRYAPVVMAVSCDEAFLELAEGTDPMAAATLVR